MTQNSLFHLQHFLPYLLNQAAETTSAEFREFYKSKYGLLRTEWRVLFHLGCYGDMLAKDICIKGKLHKTKVSRAVSSLEKRRFLKREVLVSDRRHEMLALTTTGHIVFQDLQSVAERYSNALYDKFGEDEMDALRSILLKIIENET